MILKKSVMNPIGTRSQTYDDFRFQTKVLANKVSAMRTPFPCPYGSFPFRKVTDDILYDYPKLKDVAKWYKYARKMVGTTN